MESTAMGLLSGINAYRYGSGMSTVVPPPATAMGALINYIIHSPTIPFQPMNINFGLFPPLTSPPTRKPDGTRLRGNEKTVARKQAMSARALSDLDRWIADHLRIAAAA